MRKTFGISNKNTCHLEPSKFPYQITLNIDKYELDNLVETSGAFVTVSFKLGNRKLDGIEKADIIKKVAKFKNENFKFDASFLEIPQNTKYSPQATFKEKKAEFIIYVCSSSFKSSKIEYLSTITISFSLSSYLNNQILEKDETLVIKGSKYAGVISFHIAFQAHSSNHDDINDLKSMNNSPILRRSKSNVNVSYEECKEEPKNKFSFEITKEKLDLTKNKSQKLMRKQTAPPKIIVKGPPIDHSIQKLMNKSPDELEKKLNTLLGSGLQTREETEFCNKKLENLALKEENNELKDELEKIKEEKTTLLKALADLNEEKQNWFKCFKNQESTKNSENLKFETNINKLNIDLCEKLKNLEEKFQKEEEILKNKIKEIKDENKTLRNENKLLDEKKNEQNIEILNLKNEIHIKDNNCQEESKIIESIQEKYVKLKEDLGNVLNIVLTKGNAEIMDLIEPYLNR